MQTPMIFGPVNASAQATPANKPADNTASKDSSFNQMLARQVANRGSNSPAKKASDDTDSKKSPESVSKIAPDAKPAEDGTESKKTEDIIQSPIGVTPTATAELLALVANIRQPAEKLESTVTDNAALPKVDDGLAPAVGNGKHTNPASDRALLESKEKQDLPTIEGASNPAPDLLQGLNKKGDERLLTEVAALKKNDSQSTTIAANIAASQLIGQEIGQAAKNHVSDKLTPYVGSSAWDQALGQKITLMVGATQQTATLSLNPPDLGPLQVILNITKDSADATFIAAQPEVRQALEAALPKLREMMSEAGVQLGQANVGSNMPDQHNAQSGSGNRTDSQGAQNNQHSEDLSSVTLNLNRTIQLGLVDAFA